MVLESAASLGAPAPSHAAKSPSAHDAASFHLSEGVWVGMVEDVPIGFVVEAADDGMVALAPELSPRLELWATQTYVVGVMGGCSFSLEAVMGGLLGERACGGAAIEPVFVRLVRPVREMTEPELAALIVLLFPRASPGR